VVHRFGDTTALAGIDLDISAGRTTVLIGPSGCGKSTVLRLVVGLLWPSAGLVRVFGDVVAPVNVVSLRRRIGYVIQEGGLFPHLSAVDNVTLLARHLGWDRDRCDSRVEEMCRLAHLERPVLNRLPSELSGGQRQRVALMRALMLEPELLLLDEPLGALDPMVRSGLQDELRELFAELGTTVLLVTHDLAEAAFLGDDIVLMRSGVVVQRGPFENLQRAPAEEFVSEYVSAQRQRVAL
jgi:osmoprotectant transport system ATP-binding protein